MRNKIDKALLDSLTLLERWGNIGAKELDLLQRLMKQYPSVVRECILDKEWLSLVLDIVELRTELDKFIKSFKENKLFKEEE